MSQSKLSTVGDHKEHYDEITLFWTIPNFLNLYSNAKATHKIIFSKKEFIIGLHKWKLALVQSNEEDLGIYFNYCCSYPSAKYFGYLKSSEGKFFKSFKSGLHKYAPKESAIKGANEGWGKNRFASISQLQQGFLSDDTLQLKLILGVYSGSLMKLNASRDFNKLLESGLGSDVTFKVKGPDSHIDVVKAPRAFLSIRSSYFATMFASGIKESTEGEVKIEDISPKAFRILLKYIYSGEIDADWGSVPEELFYGADKYELMELKDHLCENVEAVLTTQNVLTIRELAMLYNLPHSVLESTVKFVQNNTKEFLEKLKE